MATPLVIDNEELAALRQYAEENPISADEMRAIMAGEAPVVGEREGYDRNFDIGFRVVFTVEEHPQSDGTTKWLRHMSMSVATPGRSPSPPALGLIGEQLGFPTKDNELDYEKCQLWAEEGNEEAINAVCLME
jgi:hypothetical protein